MHRFSIGMASFALCCLSSTAFGQFNVVIQDAAGTLNNVDEAETLIATGGAPEAQEIIGTINYVGQGGAGSIGGDAPFPGGFGSTDDFALSATANITGLGTDSLTAGGGVYRFGVNSDDGFRVRLNGNVIGEFVGTRGPGDTIFDAAVKNGDQLELVFFERGGGDEVEFFTVGANNSARTLVGDAGSLQVTQSSVATPLNVLDLGYTATRVNASDNPGFDAAFNNNGLVENVDEGIALINAGNNPQVSNTLLVDSNNGFGGGDDYAVQINGYLNVLDGAGNITSDAENAFFYVTSDDGFRLTINGDLVSEVPGITGNSNSMSGIFEVETGDFLELTYFERGGGEFVQLFRDLDGDINTTDDRFLLGLTDSGILVSQTPFAQIPEPASLLVWTLLGVIGAWVVRRRRGK